MISFDYSPVQSGCMRFSQAFLLFIVLVSKITFCLSQGSSQDLEVNVRFANRTQIPGQQTPTIVEVSIGDNGTWVKVQTNGKDRRVGSVICRQLGQGPVYNADMMIADTGMKYYTVICEGTEASLKDCFIKTNTSSDYTHPFFLFVQCLPPRAQELEVFLVKRQQYLTEGIVFIYASGSWGPICAQENKSKPSLCDIMCHELGYQRCNDWVHVLEGEVFSAPVITDVQCHAGARSLQDCTFESTNSCPHSPGKTPATGDYLEVACNDRDITGDTYPFGSNYETSHFSYYNYKDDVPTGTPSTRYTPALYLVLVVVITFCGVMLYIYRKNQVDAQRVFMNGCGPNSGPQSTTLLPSTNSISEATQIRYSPGAVTDSPPPPYTATRAEQSYTPPKDDDDGVSPERDPELPTYEEVVETCQDQT